jgi:hypothetical protein
MSKKAFVPPRIAPLQRVIAEPITDPAEQAALDKMRKRIKQNQGGQKKSHHGVKTTNRKNNDE